MGVFDDLVDLDGEGAWSQAIAIIWCAIEDPRELAGEKLSADIIISEKDHRI